MAKYYGKIGFAETCETSPGVWTEQIVERSYFGDVSRISRRLASTENLNDDVNVGNEISVIADPYLNENFHAIRYLTWMGSEWKINYVEVQYPRLRLTVGGLYNGDQTSASD